MSLIVVVLLFPAALQVPRQLSSPPPALHQQGPLQLT